MKEVIEELKVKVKKHEEKLAAHKQSESILAAEYNYQKELDKEKAEIIYGKLLSTVKNIEYHTASAKTYGKVIVMLENELNIAI